MFHPPEVQRNSSPLKNGGGWKIAIFPIGFSGHFSGVPICCLNLGRVVRSSPAAGGTAHLTEDFAEVDPFELHTWHLRSNVPKDLGWIFFSMIAQGREF